MPSLLHCLTPIGPLPFVSPSLAAEPRRCEPRLPAPPALPATPAAEADDEHLLIERLLAFGSL